MRLYIFWWQGTAGSSYYMVMANSEEEARAFVDSYVATSDMIDKRKEQWPLRYRVEIVESGKVIGIEIT